MRELQEPGSDITSITKAAFTKARRYLKPSAFIELNQQLLKHIDHHVELRRWHGLRLLAVDGSKIYVPDTPEIAQHFGGQINAYGSKPQALLSQCYDVLNHLSLDVEVHRCGTSEREVALTHLRKVAGQNVFLYDRGYACFWMMAAHYDQQQYFCMRLPTEAQYLCVKTFIASKALETTLEVKIQRESKVKCKQLGISTKPFKLRLIRVDLPTGDTEVLATNLLDTGMYPHEQFQSLYQRRWAVEEDFKQQKHSLKIELYSGKTVHAVLQDIHAKVLTKNFTRLITIGAQSRVKSFTACRKQQYAINFKQALSKAKFVLLRVIRATNPEFWVEFLVEQIARCLEPVRPNRRFPRKRPVGTRAAAFGTYKPIR